MKVTREMIMNEARILGHVEVREPFKRTLAEALVAAGQLRLAGKIMAGGWWYKLAGASAALVPDTTPGPRVRFAKGTHDLGSSEPTDLTRVTEDRYGEGETGVIAFEHPNQKACPGWVFVEVDSKIGPPRKLYVGVGPRMFDVLEQETDAARSA